MMIWKPGLRDHRTSITRVTIAAVLLIAAAERGALAQSRADANGLSVRELGISTGYATVQLPSITLGGELPTDALDAGLVASATAAIDWRHEAPRTTSILDLSGTFTSRARYSNLSAPGGELTFSVARALTSRWRVNVGLSDGVATTDQLLYQQTQVGSLAASSGSFDDLAETVALAKSPNPDLSQAALFVPINQSLTASDLYTNLVMAGRVKADAIYARSARVTINLHTSYATARRISASTAAGQAILYPDSSAEGAGVAVSYARSERSQVTASFDWSQASGSYTDKALVGAVGYGWLGRKWFLQGTVGAAFRPFDIPVSGPVTTIRNSSPAIVGSGHVGYKFGTQTLVVEYRHATHDEFGHGGRDIATGFEGSVQSAAGSWSWTSPRGSWGAQASASMLRGPGNFSYIYAWLSTFSVGRQLGSSVRLNGEVLFDRHGSRGFEGFALMREGVRLNVVWAPRRRPAA